MRVGKLALITVLGVAVLATPALAKPGKLVGFGQDDGLPGAFAKGDVLRPKKLLIRINANPGEPVEVSWDTNCALRAKGKVREGEYTVTGSRLKRLKKGFKRPDDCLINVIAAYENAALAGTIEIRIYATTRR